MFLLKCSRVQNCSLTQFYPSQWFSMREPFSLSPRPDPSAPCRCQGELTNFFLRQDILLQDTNVLGQVLWLGSGHGAQWGVLQTGVTPTGPCRRMASPVFPESGLNRMNSHERKGAEYIYAHLYTLIYIH